MPARDVVVDEPLLDPLLELRERGRGVRAVEAADGHDRAFGRKLVACRILRARCRGDPAVAVGILLQHLHELGRDRSGGPAEKTAHPAFASAVGRESLGVGGTAVAHAATDSVCVAAAGAVCGWRLHASAVTAAAAGCGRHVAEGRVGARAAAHGAHAALTPAGAAAHGGVSAHAGAGRHDGAGVRRRGGVEAVAHGADGGCGKRECDGGRLEPGVRGPSAGKVLRCGGCRGCGGRVLLVRGGLCGRGACRPCGAVPQVRLQRGGRNGEAKRERP